MKRTESLSALLLAILFLFAQSVSAVPVFQVYVDGATSGTIGPDEDTWFATGNTFDLIVSGAYGPKTKSLTEITLLISVPLNETGTITITGDDGTVLLTEKTAATDGFFNPNFDAVIDLLTNDPGNPDGHDGYTDKNFLPEDISFNNHYPLQESYSNFLIYDLGSFAKASNTVSNYSTTEPIVPNIANGEEKTYSVSITGFTTAHFDVYGYEQTCKRNGFGGVWAINPGSHDATYMVPEPATIALLGMGMTVLVRPRRRSQARRK